MDPISSTLTTQINLQKLTVSIPTPPSTSNITGDTQITSSINQLRSFSTALSEFISHYDELQNHIDLINSSIDSKSPNPNYSGLLEASCDRTVQNPRERVSDPVRIWTPEYSSFSHDYDESDGSKTPEVADVSKNPVEIDISNKLEVANNHVQIADVSKDYEEIDESENHVEIDTLNSRSLHNYDESDALKKLEVADGSKDHEEIDVREDPIEIGTLKKPEVSNNSVQIDTCARDIDVSENHVESDTLNSGFSHDYVELDASKTAEVANASKDHEVIDLFENHVDIDSLKKPEVADVWMDPEEIEVCVDPVGIYSPKKLEVNNRVKNESLNMHEETVPESSCDETMADGPEAVVSEQNPNRMVANRKQGNKKHEDADIFKKPEQIDICKSPEENVVLKKHEEFDTLMIPEAIVVSKKLEETIPETSCDRTIANELDLGKPESLEEVRKKKKGYSKRRRPFIQFSDKLAIFKLQSMCRNMSTKKLKRYVATHYSKMIDLREEIANALKLATDPAKLVLNSLGRFYKTGSKRISAVSQPLYVERMASVLILECFVMISSDGVEIAKEDQEYAAKAAVDWRKRMINEGGPGYTDEVDARGLLLLISGFGIQDDVFTIQDFMDLIRASNVKGILTALCRSVFLVPKIPEVINLMVKNNLESEAVDLANIFGLEDVCHRRNILTTNLHNKSKDIQNDSPLQMNNENVIKPESVEQADILKKPEQMDVCKNPEEIVVIKKHEETIPETSCDQTTAIVSKQNPNELDLGKPESLEEVINKKKRNMKRQSPVIFKLQIKCRNMSAKKLKRHVTRHYSEMIDLREEIANALKLAEDPAKLVLNSIGRFYNSSSKTTLNAARMASVLILECFVMISSDGVGIAKEDLEYAAKAAVDWRKRMINEGGPGHTDEVDARGLLLLISGFGIQDDVFTIQDIMDLIRASNVKGILTALRRSVFLVPKIPEVINLMVKNNLEIEAVDIANIFGLEDVCHRQNILTTNLLNKIKDIRNASPLQMNNENVITPESLEEADILKKPEEAVVLKKPEETDTLMIPEENGTWVKTKEMGVVSVLQNLCQRMFFKKLKRHIAEHISEMNNLRVDIAKALKLAEDPAKLVLNSIGRFYVTSTKSMRVRDSQFLSVGRMASVLILECFVMISSDGIEIAKEDREYAVKAAVDWRKRMIDEGGPGHTDEVDARGLLLFISGFGIQDDVFTIQDIMDLIRASNVKGILTALRRSVFLIPKIPEIIYKMAHNNLEIEAVDIAYTFGLEDACHPGKILTAYLDNKIKDFQNTSPVHMLDAVKQHLCDLKSVKQCLESHNVNPSTLLPDFKINERIQNLEKEVNEWKLIHKRKSLENPTHHEAKRPCVNHQNTPHQHRPVGHHDMNRLNQSPQPSTSSPVSAQALHSAQSTGTALRTGTSKPNQPPPENRSNNRTGQSADQGRGRGRDHERVPGRGSFGRGRGSFPQTTHAPWAPFPVFWPNPDQAQYSWQQWATTPRYPYPTPGARPTQAYPMRYAPAYYNHHL